MDKSEPALIETSFAQAIATVLAAAELPEQTRRHWASSLRQIAKLLDRPPAVLPARYSAVRADLLNLHHAPAGMTSKTLQNHKSNAKSALLWLAREKGVPEHGAPLAPAWEGLRAKITDKLVRMRLSSLMRFASANDIAPEAVDEAFIDGLMAYRQCDRPEGPGRRPPAHRQGLERRHRQGRGLAGAAAGGATAEIAHRGPLGGFPRRVCGRTSKNTSIR